MKKTAYITGASSGIGEEFARQLLNTYRVVLIARNQSKLESLSQEFRKISPDSNPIILCLDLTLSF
jgi:short-subunit dehydrogenase